MFQYAAGRRLAIVHRVPLKLDTGWFNYMPPEDTTRRYALGIFPVQEDFATLDEIRSFTGESSSKIWNRLHSFAEKYGLAPASKHTVKERFLHFDQSILNLPNRAYLIGYWQSNKYFHDVENILRREFMVEAPLAGKNLEIANQIRNTNSISIHVRRGDYVSNPATTEFHGICGIEYYRLCIAELVKKVAYPHFFVFSDDHNWTHENLKIDFPVTYVDHNDSGAGYEDMRLMSLCRHNIIANSSFSWWGAWLNPNPSKLVYAPCRWFNRSDIDTKDLVPAEWIRL
jgi:hypothetical protein